MITNGVAKSSVFRPQFFPAAVTERADRPLLRAVRFLPTIEKRTFSDTGLLVPGQFVRGPVRRVSKQVPGAPVETERPHIRPCAVRGVVACFAG